MDCEQEYQYMGWGLLVGLGLGALGGALAASYYQKHRLLNADDILETIKSDFLKEGPIEGSWIQFTKEPLQKFAIKSYTYAGGITRLEDGELVQYAFIADARTGTVLDLYRL